jgi:hypothetical protein
VNYSTLVKIKSITVSLCHSLSGLGLSYLVVNKEFLFQLEINDCFGIYLEGYHCLTALTNLIVLTINTLACFDDIGLNMICSSCLLIEYLYIQRSFRITKEGLNNIHCLTHLKSLFVCFARDDWLCKLSHNTALTSIFFGICSVITDKALSQLSSLVNLTSVIR